MKLAKQTAITTLALLTALALPFAVAAQDNAAPPRNAEHHHYVVIDMGTLGGPNSVIFETFRWLNNHGTFTACGDTAALDPNSPLSPAFIFYPDDPSDPYIQHTFRWESGKKTDLGTLPHSTSSSCPQWINDRGWIVGGSTNGEIDSFTGYPATNATLWQGDEVRNLGSLGGPESWAWVVNHGGQVVGFASNTTPDQSTGPVFAWGATQARAFLWQSGRMQDLGTLGGPDSDALQINDHGQVTGVSLINSTTPQVDPFFWENGRMIDLGTFGGTSGFPDMINNRGQVVGLSNLAGDQESHAFLWEHGVLKDLNAPGDVCGEARGINDAGEAAGYVCSPGDNGSHATLWKDGKTINLGVTAEFPCSYANGISSRGQVLGALQHCPNNFPRAAFLWENGNLVDLNTLIPPSDLYLVQAMNANDRGEIAVMGALPNGDQHAVVLIPCDENHSDVEGCDYDLVDAATLQQSATSSTEQPVTGTPRSRVPTGMSNRFPSRWGQRTPGSVTNPATAARP